MTWEHWNTLQIDEERDEYRELAVDVLQLIDEEWKNHSHDCFSYGCVRREDE